MSCADRMALDLDAIEATASRGERVHPIIVQTLVELVRRYERELAAARAEQPKPFGYITPSVAAQILAPGWRKSAIGVRRDQTEDSTVPVFFANPNT